MKMEKTIFYVSDCCNAESNKDYEICSQCGEHCTIIVDDSCEKETEWNDTDEILQARYPLSVDEADYIPGLDDGEGI